MILTLNRNRNIQFHQLVSERYPAASAAYAPKPSVSTTANSTAEESARIKNLQNKIAAQKTVNANLANEVTQFEIKIAELEKTIANQPKPRTDNPANSAPIMPAAPALAGGTIPGCKDWVPDPANRPSSIFSNFVRMKCMDEDDKIAAADKAREEEAKKLAAAKEAGVKTGRLEGLCLIIPAIFAIILFSRRKRAVLPADPAKPATRKKSRYRKYREYMEWNTHSLPLSEPLLPPTAENGFSAEEFHRRIIHKLGPMLDDEFTVRISNRPQCQLGCQAGLEIICLAEDRKRVYGALAMIIEPREFALKLEADEPLPPDSKGVSLQVFRVTCGHGANVVSLPRRA